MSRTYREPCGCKHDGHRWIQMCAACAADFQERHQRAASEHQSMGIKDGMARVSPNAPISPSPKAAPTAGSVTAPGVLSSVQP